MPCLIQFSTDRKEYITDPNKMNCENIKEIYKWLKNYDGILTTKERYGFKDINKIYIKWYNMTNQHEYSLLNTIEDLQFKFSIEYKEWYTYEPSYCIECSFCIDIEQPRTKYIRLHFNILLDTNLKVLGIDPCCNYGIIITKCYLEFEIMEYKKILFYNEI